MIEHTVVFYNLKITYMIKFSNTHLFKKPLLMLTLITLLILEMQR